MRCYYARIKFFVIYSVLNIFVDDLGPRMPPPITQIGNQGNEEGLRES